MSAVSATARSAAAVIAAILLVPSPRRLLVAYHGVLAPRARWRSAVVPRVAQAEHDPKHHRAPGWLTWPTLLHRVFAIDVLAYPRSAGPRRILGPVWHDLPAASCSGQPTEGPRREAPLR